MSSLLLTPIRAEKVFLICDLSRVEPGLEQYRAEDPPASQICERGELGFEEWVRMPLTSVLPYAVGCGEDPKLVDEAPSAGLEAFGGFRLLDVDQDHPPHRRSIPAVHNP